MITEAKLSGNEFLALDKSSLEQYDLCAESQILLLQIVDELVCHKHYWNFIYV